MYEPCKQLSKSTGGGEKWLFIYSHSKCHKGWYLNKAHLPPKSLCEVHVNTNIICSVLEPF